MDVTAEKSYICFITKFDIVKSYNNNAIFYYCKTLHLLYIDLISSAFIFCVFLVLIFTFAF